MLNQEDLFAQKETSQDTGVDLYAKDNNAVPLDGAALNSRTFQIQLALGDKSPSFKDIQDSLVSGREEDLRTAVAANEDRKKLDAGRKLTVDVVQSDLGVDPVIVSELPNITPSDKNTAVEESFLNSVLDMTIPSTPNARVQDTAAGYNSDLTNKVIDIYRQQAVKETVAKNITENWEAKAKAQGWLPFGVEMVGQAIYFPSWLNMIRDPAEDQVQTDSYLPGSNMLDRAKQIWSMPPGEMYAALETEMQNLSAVSLQDAMTFLRQFNQLSDSGSLFENLNAGAAVATLGATRGAMSLTERLMKPSAKMGETSAAALEAAAKIGLTKAPTAEEELVKTVGDTLATAVKKGAGPEEVLSSAGAIDTVADLKGKKWFTEEVVPKGASDMTKVQFERLSEQLPDMYNPKLRYSDADNYANRAAREIADRATLSLKAVAEINRAIGGVETLTPEALDAAYRQARIEFENKTPAIVDHILGVLQHSPENNFGVGSIEVILGNKTSAFGSFEDAKQAADQLFKLNPDSYLIQQQGGGYYVHAFKDATEVGPGIDDLFLTKNNRSHNGMFTWIQQFTGAKTQVSDFQNVQRAGAVAAESKIQSIIQDLAAPQIDLKMNGSKQEWKDFQKMITIGQNIERVPGDPTTMGQFFKTVGELGQQYMQHFKRLPTDREVKAYFNYVQMSDLDWAMRSINIYKKKIKSGIRGFTTKAYNAEGQKIDLTIEGQVQDTLPTNGVSFMYINDTGANRVMKFTDLTAGKKDTLRAALEASIAKGEAKVIKLSDRENAFTSILGNDYDQVAYAVVHNAREAPLRIDKQLNYAPGGHVIYEDSHVVRQPIIKDGEYRGEQTLFSASSQAHADDIAKKVGKALSLYNDIKKVPKPVKKSAPAPVKAVAENTDTRGQGSRYHGAPDEIKVNGDHYTTLNYYGQGFYTTDALDIAEGYSKRKGAKAPTVYKVTETAPVKAFDAEQPVPDWLVADIKQELEDKSLHDEIDDMINAVLEDNPTSVRALYDDIRAQSASDRIPADEVQIIFDRLASKLKEKGYNALDHMGGLRTGKPAHSVRVYLDPENTIKIEKNVAKAKAPEVAPSVSEASSVEDTVNNEALTRAQDALDTYLRANLPWSPEEFKDLIKSGRIKNAPVAGMKMGQSSLDAGVRLHDGRFLSDYTDISEFSKAAFSDAYSGTRDFTQARSGPLQTLRKGSSGNPVFQLQNADKMNPIAVQQQTIGRLARNSVFEDYQFQAARSFIEEFGNSKSGFATGLSYKGKQLSIEELRKNPIFYLNNAEISKNNLKRYAQAQQIRSAIQGLLGQRSMTAMAVDYAKAALADTLYTRGHDKASEWVADKELAFLKDPWKYTRAFAFHTKLGMFNPKQYFLQGSAVINSILISPRNAFQSGKSLPLMRWTLSTEDEGIIQHYARMSEKLGGLSEKQFIESRKWLKEFNLDVVGKEYAWLSDASDSIPFRSRTGHWMLDKGPVMFNEGERQVRLQSFNTAYLDYIKDNPRRAGNLTRAEATKIYVRSQMMFGNMTRDANAFWQRGMLGNFTQFYSYNARMMELMLGTQLSAAERARLVGGYSLLWGVPVGTGIALAIQEGDMEAANPFGEDIRQYALEKGYDIHSGVPGMMYNGIAATAFSMITGENWDFGATYGLNPITIPQTIETNLQDYGFTMGSIISALGAGGGITADIVTSLGPIVGDIQQMAGGTGKTSVMVNDILNAGRNISTVNFIHRAAASVLGLSYLSKNGTLLDKETDPWIEIPRAALGVPTYEEQDTYAMIKSMKQHKEYKAEVAKRVKQLFGMYLNAPDSDKASYISQIEAYLATTDLTDKEKFKLLYSEDDRDLQSKVNESFQKQMRGLQ